MAADQASAAPIFDVDERKDVKVFYHNVAYKANRMAVNVEKMKVQCASYARVCGHQQLFGLNTTLLLLLQILKEKLGDCVRIEGVNYLTKCEQVCRSRTQQPSSLCA